MYSSIFKGPRYRQEEEVRFLLFKIKNKEGIGYDKIVRQKKKLIVPFTSELLHQVIVNHTVDKIEGENITSII